MTYTGAGIGRVLKNLFLGSALVLTALLAPVVVLAHPGNTDSSGCHTCHTNCTSWGLSYEEYHCHNPKPYTPSYTPPPTPSCPSMSSYDSYSGSCKCYSGYVVGTDIFGKESCVSADSKCTTDHGYGARWNSLNGTCECRYGYIMSGNKCVSESQYCSDLIGYNSNYNSLYDRCECDSGYVIGTDFLGGQSCVSADSKCKDDYGYGAKWNSLYDKCECSNGYVLSGGKCVDESSYCRDLIGLMSTYNSFSEKCECMSGYEFNGSSCVYKTKNYSSLPDYSSSSSSSGQYTCPANSHTSITDSTKCTCDTGYQVDSSKTFCVVAPVKTNDQVCQDSYGSNSHWDGTLASNGNLNCNCKDGYQWNQEQTACFVIPSTPPVNESVTPAVLGEVVYNDIDQTNDVFVQSQIDTQETVDTSLVKRLGGRILLQTQSHGEAWYVNPGTGKRFYMKDGSTAYEMLRAFGLGITNADFQKLQNGDSTLVKRLKGRIVLQVESHGEAYYIVPSDGSARYLKDGEAAYQVMRELGLGITNSDLNHLPISKFVPVKK